MSNHRIDREHPDYLSRARTWRKFSDLYAGGERFLSNASDYLVRRHKEPSDVYFERLSRVFYENYIGSIIDWYAATLTRREPVVQFDGNDDQGKAFFGDFIQNCDWKGTTLPEFFKQRFVELLIYGRSYMVVDFPRIDHEITSRAEEDALGRSRAYLVDYSPDEVINWSHDAEGRLEWIVIRTTFIRQASVEEDWKRETRWIYYDREHFQLYSAESRETGHAVAPVLIAEGLHGLAALKRVPVFEMRVSEGLWLMNKASLLQLEHFNKSNALAWALTMGLFATPVIYSDREWNQIVGESYYIQLGPEDKFGWTEPTGNVFQIASDNLERLKDEIYRICYLVSQVSGAVEHRLPQSGLSKQRDFSITQDILRSYGDVIKDTMRRALEAIAEARQDSLQIDVSGLDEFDIRDFSSDLDDAQKLLTLGIQSNTFKQQLFKRVALKYFCDSRQGIKNKIAAEIDESFQNQAAE